MRDKVLKITRLSGSKNFVSKKEKFIFNMFVDLKLTPRNGEGSHGNATAMGITATVMPW